MSPTSKSDLLQLANDYIDGRLDAEGKSRLQELLLEDPEARRIFSDFLHDHAELFWGHVGHGEAERTDPDLLMEMAAVGDRPARRRFPSWAVASLVALLALLVMSLAGRKGTEDEGELAHITLLSGIAVDGAGQELAAEASLGAGSAIRMESGVVQVVFERSRSTDGGALSRHSSSYT